MASLYGYESRRSTQTRIAGSGTDQDRNGKGGDEQPKIVFNALYVHNCVCQRLCLCLLSAGVNLDLVHVVVAKGAFVLCGQLHLCEDR